MRFKIALMIGLAGCLGLTACNGDISGSSDAQVSADSLHQDAQSIINGEKDKSKEHDAVVSLFPYHEPQPHVLYLDHSSCTGTLIHPRWVLTAAHCVADLVDGKPVPGPKNSLYKISVGNDLEALRDTANMHDIEKIIFHPDFHEKALAVGGSHYYTIGNDIALVKLKQPIAESDIKPIKTLPKWLGIKRNDLTHNVKAEIVGYGITEKNKTDVKMKATVTLNDYCGGANSDSSNGCKHGPVSVTGCHPSQAMCNNPHNNDHCSTGYYCFKDVIDNVWLSYGTLYYEKNPSGGCQGDSGGPAIVRIGGEAYVAGLTSYGDAACAKTNVSTATQDFYDWIIAQAPEIASSYVEICGNGVDDDGNGVSDCADPVCAGNAGCEPEICDNGVDDNHNGSIDCDDPVCSRNPACTFGIDVTEVENCFNGFDDNMDGDIDCGDVQCKFTDRCVSINNAEESSGGGCQSVPNAPTRLPFGMMILGVVGAGVLLRRRKAE